MRSSLPVILSLLLLTLRAAAAQTADDYFNRGAQLYISDQVPLALAKVEDGLKAYPGDAKLKKLEELLKKPPQSQNSQSQQNQKQQSQSQQQQNKQQTQQKKPSGGQGQQQGQPSSQPKSQEQKKGDEPAKKQEQQNSSAQKGAAGKPGQNAEGQPAAPGQMTPEEAKRLLDAQKGSEQMLQVKPQGKPQDSQRPVRDW